MSDSLVSFPSTWTAPTSCFASTNYYYVLLDGGSFFSNMYGTPTPVLTGNTPSGDCVPPSFTINQPYLTDGDCPRGYTTACATGSPESTRTVTCCPSVTRDVFSFMCKENEYGCHATATVGAVWTGTETNIDLETPTESPLTKTPSTEEGIEAWGIKLISVPVTATATETATATDEISTSNTIEETTAAGTTAANVKPTHSTPSPDHKGLSTGAAAGIGVGSAAVVILLALGALLLYRHRRKKQRAGGATPAGSERDGAEMYKYPYQPTALGTAGNEVFQQYYYRTAEPQELEASGNKGRQELS
ncbi:hypothetical protein GMORB2_4836 [Geosmithia morbida]|uniref:Uncharacterized protein n=1 Tax=Geosmithia morbida TaxID=1094350 RepID=A0A9P4YPA3_9HYPO|nr:uncharacterized protein GMORB2_4836 [Geosmithia morbida]KAF4119317.1 hypothetical protein GMORB2_4836 [Geosmithia morbida]